MPRNEVKIAWAEAGALYAKRVNALLESIVRLAALDRALGKSSFGKVTEIPTLLVHPTFGPDSGIDLAQEIKEEVELLPAEFAELSE